MLKTKNIIKMFNLFNKKPKSIKENNLKPLLVNNVSFLPKYKFEDYFREPNELEKKVIDLGWEFTFPGAEGPYFDKDKYRLQFIQQTKDWPSVYNFNYEIEGTQNLMIFTKKYFDTIFFGYVNNAEELDQVFKLLRI